MSRESFRESIFRVIEYLNNYELSDNAKKLVLHYFNESRASSSQEKALYAIERYIPEKLTQEQERPGRLAQILEEMLSEADRWDEE